MGWNLGRFYIYIDIFIFIKWCIQILKTILVSLSLYKYKYIWNNNNNNINRIKWPDLLFDDRTGSLGQLANQPTN